jgi:hypothetical protein
MCATLGFCRHWVSRTVFWRGGGGAGPIFETGSAEAVEEEVEEEVETAQ